MTLQIDTPARLLRICAATIARKAKAALCCKNFQRATGGVAAVEFTLVFPLLSALLGALSSLIMLSRPVEG